MRDFMWIHGLAGIVVFVTTACSRAEAPSTAKGAAAPAPATLGPPRREAPNASVSAPAAPTATTPSCEALTSLPDRSAENTAFVAEVAKNVAGGLQVLTCSAMARDGAGDDLFGHPMFVACQPPRLCSVGRDGRRGGSDDACTELHEADVTTARRSMPAGWERHFLVVTPEMRPGCTSPNAAVVHFYAGLMRRDGSHLAALPPRHDWDDMLEQKMEKHQSFFFRTARLQGLSCGSDHCRFEIELGVSSRADGPVSRGTDQGELERRGERWVVVRPPT